MSKFMQMLIIVVLVALAARVVLEAVAPLVPYAIIAGLGALIAVGVMKKKQNRW